MVAPAATAPVSAAERERDLCVRAKAGDRDALGDLLAMHDAYFKMAAVAVGVDPDDGAQEARIAAIQALAAFDPSAGFRFLTYASKKIFWVLRHYRAQDGVIWTPHWQNISKTSPDTKRLAMRAKRVASIDAAATDHGDSWAGYIPDRSDVVRNVIGAENAALVKAALGRIPAREREVLTRRLDGDTLADIGKDLDVSKERVRQIEAAAIESLRGKLVGRMAVA